MSGTRVTVTGGNLVVEPKDLDKVWSFTRRIVVPMSAVKGVSVRPAAEVRPRGRRWPGLRLFGKVSGRFVSDGRRQFWNVSGRGDVVIIRLASQPRFDELVLTVDDPSAVAGELHRRGSRG